VTIDEDRAGQRLDNFLMAELNGVPKSRIYRMLRTGEVRVSGRRAKASDRLQAGDKVRIPPVREAVRAEKPLLPDTLKDDIRSRILLEQPAYLVVNKPAGLAVHGGSGVSFGLIEASWWRVRARRCCHCTGNCVNRIWTKPIGHWCRASGPRIAVR